MHEFETYTPEEKAEFLRLAATLDHHLDEGDWVWLLDGGESAYLVIENHLYPGQAGCHGGSYKHEEIQWLPTADQLLKRKEWNKDRWKLEYDFDWPGPGWGVGESYGYGQYNDISNSPHLCLAMLRAMMVGDASA
jgi:hypothetical protein